MINFANFVSSSYMFGKSAFEFYHQKTFQSLIRLGDMKLHTPGNIVKKLAVIFYMTHQPHRRGFLKFCCILLINIFIIMVKRNKLKKFPIYI